MNFPCLLPIFEVEGKKFEQKKKREERLKSWSNAHLLTLSLSFFKLSGEAERDDSRGGNLLSSNKSHVLWSGLNRKVL